MMKKVTWWNGTKYYVKESIITLGSLKDYFGVLEVSL